MSNKLHFWVGSSVIVLSVILTIIIFTVFKSLPPKLPLFYSLPWGDVQLATQEQFLIIPVSISAVAILNLLIAGQLHSSQAFFKKALLTSSLVVTLIFIITFIKIVLNFA